MQLKFAVQVPFCWGTPLLSRFSRDPGEHGAWPPGPSGSVM